MQPKTTKERLMTYPKEVIVDYLVADNPPVFNIDFRRLEARKYQARTQKLMDEWAQIAEQQKPLDLNTSQGRARYWKLHERVDRIMSEVDRLGRKQNALYDRLKVAAPKA